MISTACNDQSRHFSAGSGWGNGFMFDEETALRKIIVRDVLGGVLSLSVDPNVVLPPPVNEEDMSAISINASYPEEENIVEKTYVFKDEENRDALKVTAEGKKEEISMARGKRIVKFSKLKLKFEFDKFVFSNACGFRAYVNGEIQCQVSGRYNKEDETFSGWGNCSAGMSDDTNEFIYVFQDKEQRSVRMAVNVKIDGDIFDLKNYTFAGIFNVDNRLIAIENKFEEERVCMPLAESQ